MREDSKGEGSSPVQDIFSDPSNIIITTVTQLGKYVPIVDWK